MRRVQIKAPFCYTKSRIFEKGEGIATHYKTVKGILSAQNGMNLYRGCTHGCIYCDTHSDCYQFDHAFEDIEIKENAIELLRQALQKKRKKCMIATGSMCDPYLPLEKTERLTRRCLELIDQQGFGLTLITKSDLVLRDLDLLKSIHQKAKCVVQITLTTADEALCKVLEPNVATTAQRIAVLNQLRDAGIPTVVWLCPILPFINDTEENLRAILSACFAAKVKGIICFGMGVTLRRGSREHFYQQLDKHFPKMKQRYIEAFGDAYECGSPNQHRLMQIFQTECAAQGVLFRPNDVFDYLKEFPEAPPCEQLSLF